MASPAVGNFHSRFSLLEIAHGGKDGLNVFVHYF
jgi:hypothetical protein